MIMMNYLLEIFSSNCGHYLGKLWFSLFLFGLVRLLLVAIICNSISRLIFLRLGRDYKCINPYFISIIISSIELLFARVC
jgi:hypothetical protein